MTFQSEPHRREIVFSADGRPFECSPVAALILRKHEMGNSDEEIADAVRRDHDVDLGAKQISELRSIVEQKVRASSYSANIKRQGILFRQDILSEAGLQRVSRPFLPLFNLKISLGVISLTAILVMICRLKQGATIDVRDSLSVLNIALGYAVAFAILAFHEVGHSAALLKFGMRPKSLGVGIFLIFPFVYTDVTRAWLLPRAQRVIVDSGGIYLQLVITGVIYATYCRTHFPFLPLSISISLGSLIFAINPLMRNDGYWVLCDLVGISDLKSTSYRSLRSLLTCGTAPRVALAGYAIIDIAFTCLFLVFSVYSFIGVVMRGTWLRHEIAIIGGGGLAFSFAAWSLWNKVRRLHREPVPQ